MPMFGSGVRSGPSNWSDILSLVGATMRDMSPGSDGASIGRAQQMMSQRQMQAMQLQGMQKMMGMFGGSAPKGALPEMPDVSVGMPQGPAGGLGPVDDAGGAMGASMASLAPAASPAPAAAPQVPDYAALTKSVSKQPNLYDPQTQQTLAMANMLGLPGADKVQDLIKELRPDIQVAPDGTTFDKRNPASLGHRFGNPGNVNNTIVDLNDPENINRVIPSAPAPGAMPQYDNRGRVQDWSMPQGAVGAITAAKAAESAGSSPAPGAMPVFDNLGRVTDWRMPPGALGVVRDAHAAQAGGSAAGAAPYDLRTVQGPNGPITAPLPAFLGGAISGQSPADRAYTEDTAKASAAMYNGIQANAAAATGKMNRLRQVGTLLGDFDGGKYAPAGLEIASALNSLGFKMDRKMANAQAADAVAKQIALELRDPSGGAGMPGSLSNADRDFLQKMAPGLLQSAAGRKQLIEIGVKTYQRQQDVGGMARKWQTRFGRLDTPDASGKGFQDYLNVWAEAHPLLGGK